MKIQNQRKILWKLMNLSNGFLDKTPSVELQVCQIIRIINVCVCVNFFNYLRVMHENFCLQFQESVVVSLLLVTGIAFKIQRHDCWGCLLQRVYWPARWESKQPNNVTKSSSPKTTKVLLIHIPYSVHILTPGCFYIHLINVL